MKAKIFSGQQLADKLTQQLKPVVKSLVDGGRELAIAAILFEEDKGSVLYTKLKQEAAEFLGIKYEVHRFSLLDPLSNIVRRISELNDNEEITGIIIQKPWRKTWIDAQEKTTNDSKQEFKKWWGRLVEEIDPSKDVDGLHPSTYLAIKAGNWQNEGKVLPATTKAVITILKEMLIEGKMSLENKKIVILGKSDLLGRPLHALFKSENINSEMIGSLELKQRIKDGIFLKDADVVISSTGRNNLVTGEMIKDNAIVIDVGEPIGDVEMISVANKASFLTPVPGGVGPMTVVCLMENAVELIANKL